MKRLVALFLSFVLVLSCLTGCKAEDTGSTEGPVTITIWHDKENQVIQVLADYLSVLEPDIHIVFEKKEGLTDSLKLVGNDPSAAPDMYFFAHDKIGVYAEMGILAPITDFVSMESLNSYIDSTLTASTYKGALYQMPIYYETLLFMYNKDLMKDSDVPNTTEKLYTYMKNNTGNGHYGFVEQHSTAYYSIPWIHGFGGELISADGTPLLTSNEVINSMNYHLKFMEYMPSEGEYSTVNTLFLEGMADSIIGGPWLVPTAREAGINLGFSKMPIVDETGKALAPYMGVQGLHVLKLAAETKHDAIEKILNTVMSPELGASMAKISGCAPANEQSYSDEAVAGDEMVICMKEIADTAVAMPNIPEMDIMFVIAGNMLVAVNMKGTDVNKAAQDNQSKAETLINAMK